MIITSSPPGESQSEYESSELDALLAEQPDLQQTLDRLVAEAVRTTFGDAAAIVLVTDGVVVAASATAALAAALERGLLVSAAQTRRSIGVAEGILMERHGLEPSAAFDRLRQRGADDHTTLLVAAEAIAVEAAD